MAAGLCVSVVWQSLVCGLLWVCGDGLLGGVGVLHYIYIYLYIYITIIIWTCYFPSSVVGGYSRRSIVCHVIHNLGFTNILY